MLAGVAHFAHDTYRNVVAVQKDRSRSQCDLASMRVCQGVCEPDLGTKCYHISMTVILILQSSSCTTYTNSVCTGNNISSSCLQVIHSPALTPSRFKSCRRPTRVISTGPWGCKQMF